MLEEIGGHWHRISSKINLKIEMALKLEETVDKTSKEIAKNG